MKKLGDFLTWLEDKWGSPIAPLAYLCLVLTCGGGVIALVVLAAEHPQISGPVLFVVLVAAAPAISAYAITQYRKR